MLAMTQGPDTPTWLAWIAPAVAAIGGLLAVLRTLFVTPGRLQEMLNELEKRQEDQRLALHEENRKNWEGVFSRLSKVEQSQARTEGILTGRHPTIRR